MYPGNVRGLNNTGNNNPGGQQPGCKEYIQKFWDTVPLFVRIVIIVSLVMYILSFTSFVIPLLNIPQNTIFSFFIWSVVTSVLVNISIFNILFAFMSWVPSAIQQETSSGTIKYLFNFFLHSTLIQILYVFFAV